MIFIKKNALWIAILAIVGLMLTSTGLTIYSSKNIDKNTILLNKIEELKKQTLNILTGTMHGLDLGVRGFAVLKQEGLLNPYERAINENEDLFNKLYKLHAYLHYPTDGLDSVKTEVDNYISISKQMVAFVRIDSIRSVQEILKEDKGYIVWKQYESYRSKLFAHLDKLEREAELKNQKAGSILLAVQIIMLLFSLPIFGFIIYKIKSDKTERIRILRQLDVYNKNYVFNDGKVNTNEDEKEIIQNSISDMQEAVNFVKAITSGNYDIEWKGYATENAELNKDNLSGQLHTMRYKMLEVKEEDQKKIWANEGMAKFGELLREYANTEIFTDKVVSFIANYLNVNQVWLFDRKVNAQGNNYLLLESCYAFDRKKYIEKEIQPGEGLVGEAFREKNRIFLTEIPTNYIEITSGLGGAQPNCILIEPLIFNEQVEGVLEIASFTALKVHELAFVQKLAESLASTLSIHQTNQQTKELLAQTQAQTELMRQQEEEMRQNMEELMATQEEMERKHLEFNSKNELLELIFDTIPYPVFVKDEQFKYLIVNKAEAELFKVSKSEIIGFSDSKFVSSKEEFEQITLSDNQAISGLEPIELPDQHISLKNGEKVIFRTLKIPFVHQISKTKHILGISFRIS